VYEQGEQEEGLSELTEDSVLSELFEEEGDDKQRHET
jgi:hypothetical protein